MLKKLLSLTVVLCFLSGGTAMAKEVYVVDMARVMADSKPAKLADEHLGRVQKVLQGGLESVQKLYVGKEESEEAKKETGEAYNALNRQLNIERQAALNELNRILLETVEEVRAKRRYPMVVSRQSILAFDPQYEITSEIIVEFNKKKPKFPDLPTVTINPEAVSSTKPAIKSAPNLPQRK